MEAFRVLYYQSPELPTGGIFKRGPFLSYITAATIFSSHTLSAHQVMFTTPARGAYRSWPVSYANDAGSGG